MNTSEFITCVFETAPIKETKSPFKERERIRQTQIENLVEIFE
jgi:hypothetical protein